MAKTSKEDVKQKEVEKKPKKPQVYRTLKDMEQSFLFSIYDKHNGNMSEMVLDPQCPFHAYPQVHHYVHKYEFKKKLVEIRTNRTVEVLGSLKDAKVLAIKRATELLQSKTLTPNEIKVAYDIIKIELGEPTKLGKLDLTSKGERIVYAPGELLEKHEVD
jgi:hypothetical protein